MAGSKLQFLGALLLAAASTVRAEWVDPAVLDKCPGYNAENVNAQASQLTADLVLAGNACNVFGKDAEKLKLEVTYETEDRIHLKITDPSTARYEVPESVLPRPSADSSTSPSNASIQFTHTTQPFTFSIQRTSTNETLFSTADHPLIFEPQYLRLKTSLPADANIYGIGEHTDTFRLPTHNHTRTLWSRDAYGVPNATNLYGNHPVYYEHRPGGTHGVFLLNSNGMDVKINDTEGKGTTLEYNVIGGVLDFYFLAGSETDPTEVARQYAEVVGTPAEVPYWSFGFHNCRYGYADYVEVADAISNYSDAKIPLETMWTDIDYMYKRRVFTLDPDYFPLDKMREIVDYLHAHDQHYVLMTDPAVPYLPSSDYAPYMNGSDMGIFMKNPNGSEAMGIVWPGVTVFPDWFNNKTQDFWSGQFQAFYSPETGIDIDGAWIDMNEPSSFCNYPCTDPFAQAVEQDLPPNRTTSAPSGNTTIFPGWTDSSSNSKRDGASSNGTDNGEGDFNLLNPPYNIDNAAGVLSNKTANVTNVHANGLNMYDTHNLYGTMMSTATRNALLARRPGKRTLVITRSTFAGAGAHVGKWLGDNFSTWDQYRASIAGILGMATVYQVPMVGADICGYAQNTTETLCARWATLGAFYPFMRNHNDIASIPQEFYRWPSVAEAARNAIDIRYRFMDYIYTAFHQAHQDGTPVLRPLWMNYPSDANTFPIDLQYFFGPSLLVSPVTDENSTSVTYYLPNDTFYAFPDFTPVQGSGANVTQSNVSFSDIPLHIRGGAILPLRAQGAMTTTELRKVPFEIVVAPDAQGKASGALYVDDGESITPDKTTELTFAYDLGLLSVKGKYEYGPIEVERVVLLGVGKKPSKVSVQQGGAQPAAMGESEWTYDGEAQKLNVTVGVQISGDFSVNFS
ncbi:glycoside hydrolase family 31 protein [Coniophora puteana RWD-64-598 SS2]|uniref:beta-glucosidase n=1 Tax=Coniophora puteana (strain RWD-64-598) TaxID=741705 RepID=A0A5M3MTR9_CONPW|nr:glycoside hydrolase family 31 protein [Coniophora puteana RWD-64-598 SS2]EIW82144.1 glycoside hydrolase family 31 protein [Coniophora puteana RWD-64-598 SS2]